MDETVQWLPAGPERSRPGRVPAIYAPNLRAAQRFVEFFAANIRNANTRRAYVRAVVEFSNWCELQGLHELGAVQPFHVAAFIEGIGERLSKPSVKQTLAALRAITPEVRVLLISGYSESSRVARLAGVGPLRVMQKPFSREDLERKLREVLG